MFIGQAGRVCNRWMFAVAAIAMLVLGGSAWAGNVYVPNFSFESPDIGTNSPYAAPELESWQETAQPSWYEPTNFDGAPWYYQTGTFYNEPDFTNSTQTNTSFIFNCNGVQAAYFQVVPQVGIHQTLDATFNVGKAYNLTVGLLGGGGGMVEGSHISNQPLLPR